MMVVVTAVAMYDNQYKLPFFQSFSLFLAPCSKQMPDFKQIYFVTCYLTVACKVTQYVSRNNCFPSAQGWI